VIQSYSDAVAEYWSIGVMECWSVGVLECVNKSAKSESPLEKGGQGDLVANNHYARFLRTDYAVI
jgi:hypothetical protein